MPCKSCQSNWLQWLVPLTSNLNHKSYPRLRISIPIYMCEWFDKNEYLSWCGVGFPKSRYPNDTTWDNGKVKQAPCALPNYFLTPNQSTKELLTKWPLYFHTISKYFLFLLKPPTTNGTTIQKVTWWLIFFTNRQFRVGSFEWLDIIYLSNQYLSLFIADALLGHPVFIHAPIKSNLS